MKPPSEMSTTELLLLDRDLRNRLPTAPGFPFKCRLRILMYREEIRAELEKRQAYFLRQLGRQEISNETCERDKHE
jgi:hypothetical protein